MLEDLRLETFSGHVGEVFRLYAGEASPLELELIEAKSLGEAPQDGMREPFSIVFRGPNEPILPQASYKLEHDEIVAQNIFLVPLGPGRDDSAMRYEAVFT